MPTVIENNGQIIWGRDVTCPECGDEWESLNPQTPDGGLEICDDCIDRERAEETHTNGS